MNVWLVYAVAVSNILVMYGLFVPRSISLTYNMYISRNREWFDANAAFNRRYPPPRYSIWLCYFAGIAWLVLCTGELLIHGATARMGRLVFLPSLFCLLPLLLYMGVEYFRVLKKIPLPTRRSVVLERRSLRDIVNPHWLYLAYLLLATIAGLYVAAFYGDRITANIFSQRMIGVTVGVLLTTLMLVYSIRRKKQPLDEALGRGYRNSEVIGEVICLYMFVLVGTCRLLQDVFAIRLASDGAMLLGMSVLVQAICLFWVLHPGVKKVLARNPPAAPIGF